MSHVTVMLREAVDALNVKPDGAYVDCTVGLGGHSHEIARRLTAGGGGKLVAIDRDSRAIAASRERLAEFGDTAALTRGEFGNLDAILTDLGIDAVDGILADFGVSSPQLDNAERGFSYSQPAPLDMRMDESAALTAYEIVNTWDEQVLRRILRDYGEERYAARIASGIVKHREAAPIETTDELAAVIKAAMPGAALREAQHPAKRSFQAFRCAVNDELGEIERLLAAAPERLKPGGRVVCISFHSLEDRLVKNAFNARADGCKCVKSLPCVCGFVPSLKIVTRKPMTPGADETGANPRARSAKMRVAEKL